MASVVISVLKSTASMTCKDDSLFFGVEVLAGFEDEFDGKFK